MFKNPKYQYGAVDRFVPANLNFGEYILKKIWELNDTIALINGLTDEKVTYGQIAQEAMNVAVSLIRLGVKKGDVIAVSSENRTESWGTIIAICCTGAIATTLNTGYTNDELKHVLSISKPKYLFCSPFTYKMHANIYKNTNCLKTIIMYGDESPRNTILYKDLAIPSNEKTNKPYKIKENVDYAQFQPIEVDGQIDKLFILYSSGTTGLPKGVVLTHYNVLVLCSPSVVTPPLKTLTITPWYHTMGLIGILVSFVRGLTIVYLPKFEVELYLKTIEKYKVIISICLLAIIVFARKRKKPTSIIEQLTAVPPVLVAICKSNLKYDTSSLIFVHCGAAPLYEETAQAVKDKFPSVQAILQGYGMTEATLAITFNYNPDKIGSVGTPYPHTVVKVVDPETKEVLGPNKAGEICFKSVMLMKGYIGKDRKEDFDEEGFLKTGDIGYYDDEGYFFIVDRLKELIKYNAYQVPPAEIEAVLLKHPAIQDAGVVGIPNLKNGEVPLAFVVVKPGEKLTEKEVKDFVAERLSNPKHLRGGVRFINEIPKNQTGKILRRELKKIAKSSKIKNIPSHLNFGQYILDIIWSNRDKVALINGATHEKITYREIAQDAMNFAISLTRMGIKRGDTIAVCTESRQEYFGTFIGIVCTGATFTPISMAYIKDEMKHVLNISKPKMIVCSTLAYKTHSETLKSLPFIEKFVLYGNKVPNILAYDELLKTGVKCTGDNFLAADVEGQTDTAIILYSSGTTGLPKGVMLTHLNIISVAQIVVPPPVIVALCKTQGNYDASSVKVAYCGAAPLRSDTIKELRKRFPGVEHVLQAYGMTESSLSVTRDTYDQRHLCKMGSVGRIINGIVIKIVDVETGKPLGVNQPGEIRIKGPVIMKGYVGKDRSEDFDDEGFYKTGDIGYYDEDKCFFIVERLKELIKYKGYQVPPAEIEAVLLQNPSILDAGVIGIPDKSAGEVPRAYVVLRPEAKLSEADVKKFVAEKLSHPKHLRGGVRFVNEIPKNPSGKILRRKLREMAKITEVKSKL
ncbi:uncharacterized protein LOC123667733 [Melitaea cinxia]|uniref:uncharacterized protein LOC123667733 n=1 Tax=Melitaea cinxia TaxID=113334 RepID=UPI001E26E96F|nr:uncharacterized protein LOC123667733 [Melitaea cinxia]